MFALLLDLSFGRKVMTNLDSILKSRDITLPTKVHIIKAMVFLVVMYGYESWTIKKTEHWRIDAFELWYWRRLLRVLWISRGSNPGLLHYRQILYHLSHQGSPPLPTSSATSTNKKTAVSEKEKVQRKSQYFVPWSNLSLDKAMGFPVVMYGCESWTIKKTEHWRIDAFELWCWRRLLRVPGTVRRSNQSILK